LAILPNYAKHNINTITKDAMSNIIKFPTKYWMPKPKSFYSFVKPAKMFAAFIAITTFVAILTAALGPISFIVMALILMFYTMAYLP